MVKFDVTLLRYLEKEDFRVLIAVEMGMKNHELVPDSLVAVISSLRGGGVAKILQNLCRHRLLAYERGKRYDGYRLTYLGYDYIALNALRCSGSLSHVGNQIGVGKESDVYVATGDEGQRYALKLHRLGRICFRNVNNKRDYHSKGRKLSSWIYASRLAATRESAFMKILYEEGFPVPQLVASNRHVVVMQLLEGTLLNNLLPNEISDPDGLYEQLMSMILTLANKFGLVHGDFNEFNIMILSETSKPVLIDFPQMVPVNHKFAKSYFERDVQCIASFFNKRFDMAIGELPDFEKDVEIDSNDSERIQIPDLPEFPTEFLDGEETNEPEVDIESMARVVSELTMTEQSKDEADRGRNNSEPSREDCVDDDDDTLSDRVSGTFSTISRSTVAPEEVKNRVKREKSKAKKKQELKLAAKSIKGEDSAVFRKRKEALHNIRDDLAIHVMGEM